MSKDISRRVRKTPWIARPSVTCAAPSPSGRSARAGRRRMPTSSSRATSFHVAVDRHSGESTSPETALDVHSSPRRRPGPWDKICETLPPKFHVLYLV